MRAISLFVSALALVSMSQATPLVDTEFAQLDAELELEAGLPMQKADAQKLLKHMEKFLEVATNGHSFQSETVKSGYWKDELGANWKPDRELTGE